MSYLPAAIANAQRYVEAVLTDTCAITRNPGSPHTQDVDPTTGALIPGAGATTVWADLPCLITQVVRRVSVAEQGGAAKGAQEWIADVPARALGILGGDILTVTTSASPSLVGRVFLVDANDDDTLVPDRQLALVAYARRPRQ